MVIVLSPAFILDRFERALESARETLRKARSTFQEAAIATEHKELFGYGGKAVKGKSVKGKKKIVLLLGQSSFIA